MSSIFSGNQFYRPGDVICNSKRHLAGMVLPWWLLLIADWLTLGREERGGSLRVGGGGRLLDRSSLGWKFPTAYTPCIQTHTHTVRRKGACSKNISIKKKRANPVSGGSHVSYSVLHRSLY